MATFEFKISKLLLTCNQACFQEHTQRDGLFLKLSFPHSCGFFSLLLPISHPECLTIPLYPSICPQHTGFTSLLSTMACFKKKKWVNGWIRKQQKDKGCSKWIERKNESTRTPVACYLITAAPACHARLTGPLRTALAPCKTPSIQQPLSHFSLGTKEGNSLWFLSCPHQICVS